MNRCIWEGREGRKRNGGREKMRNWISRQERRCIDLHTVCLEFMCFPASVCLYWGTMCVVGSCVCIGDCMQYVGSSVYLKRAK